MEDVVDDFSTLGRVAARLGEWRTSDVDSYQSAYVSLVLHRWVLPSSFVQDLISLSWQNILPHRETSPALLVTFHIYCCYFWAALVCTGNHEAEWTLCNSIMYNFSLPPIAWAPRRLWTNSPKTLTGFYFPPLLRRFHEQILSSILSALELNLWKGGDGKAGWDCSICLWSSVNKPNQQVNVKVVLLCNSNCSLSISYCLCPVGILCS